MPESGFFIFWFFFAIFFSQFSSPGRVWTEFGTKIFFSLFQPISPILANNNAGKRFFLIFWIFLIFFLNFLAVVEYDQNLGLKFFSLFLVLSHPVLANNNAGKQFFIFSICLQFFSEFSFPAWVGTEFGTKFFFSLSWPLSTLFG